MMRRNPVKSELVPVSVDQSRRRIIDLSAQIRPHGRELARGNRE